MSETPVYRIAKWETTFEKADSRRHKSLNWISVPIGFSSNGFAQLIEDFGDEAPSIYGAWIALAKIAGSCPVRGILSTSSGAGLTAGRLSFMSHFPSTVFERLLDWASSQPVGWVEVVASEEVERLINDQQTSAERLPNELQDKTRQDITEHNTTTHDNGSVVRSSVVDWDSLDGIDLDGIERRVTRFRRATSLRLNEVDSQMCVRIAALDQWQGTGLLSSLATELASGRIRKPDRYVAAALTKKCEEVGVTLQEFTDRADAVIARQVAKAKEMAK